VRFAAPASDHRYLALVVALDDPKTPMAETWRQVGREAPRLGLPRPGYHMVRVLVKSVRAAAAAREATKAAVADVFKALASPYVVELRRALGQLVDAYTHQVLVLEQHKPP
jgi:hypothetical protein